MPDERYTHISLWALLSAPLLIGCDLSRLDDFTLNLLTNDEVIEIGQDPLGNQTFPVDISNESEIYVKELEDGSKAIGLVNLSSSEINIVADWEVLQLSGMGEYENLFSAVIPAHGVVLLKISK